MDANKENCPPRVCELSKNATSNLQKRKFEEYTLSDIRQLPRPVLYHVAQPQRTKIILVLDLKSNRDVLEDAPLLMAVKLNPNSPNFRPFDKYHVTSYQMAVIGGQEQPMQTFKGTSVRSWWKNERLISTAHAAGYRVITQMPERWTPGFVQYAKQQNSSKRYIDVITRGMKTHCRLYDHQIKAFHHSLPDPGSLIEVKVTTLLEGQLEFENYFLPKEYDEENGHVIQKARNYATEARNYSQSDNHLKNYPYDSEPENFQKREIEDYEEVLLASAMFAQSRVKEAFLSTCYEPEVFTVHQKGLGKKKSATINFTINPPAPKEDPKILSKRIRFWTPETILRFEPSHFNPKLERTGLKAVITEATLLDNMGMEITLKLDSDQIAVVMDKASDLLEGEKTEGYKFYPDPDNTGYESAIRCLKYKKLSKAVEDDKNKGRQQILEMLLGKKRPQQMADGEELEIDLPQKQFRLSATQSIALRSTSIPTNRIFFQQAPAGTGKTLITALCLWKWLQSSEDLILAVAPTNHAIQNLAKTFFSLAGEMEVGKVLFLQSTNAEVMEFQEDDECWKQCRVPELLDYFYTNRQDLSKEQKEQMQNYLNIRISHDGTAYRVTMAFELLLSLTTPRIIFGTVSMASTFLDHLEENDVLPTYLAVDETGLLSDIGLLTFVTALPRIQQVFLTGDVMQLPAYTGALPEKIIPFGHGGSIHSIDSRKAIMKIVLKDSYRSHPILVQALSRAAYDGSLLPATTTNTRKGWKSLGLPPPNDDLPILLLDVKGSEERTITYSWTNEQQNSAAIALYHELRKATNQSIVLLSFYSSTVTELKQACPVASVFTVDSFMGKESDYVILITTRTNDIKDKQKMKFIFNANRTTVALSRAREGMFIIGNLELLESSEIWNQFIGDAKQERYHTALEVFLDWLKGPCGRSESPEPMQ